MTLLKRIISPKKLIYIFFILLHIFLLNVNVAEWGDSYRILRASESIRDDFTYPTNEKRPPLYSLVLAVRPDFIDPILWGRIFMLGVSVVFIFTFEKFLRLFIKDEKYINIGLILLAFNPVFLYWSLRIYADVFFSLLVLFSLLIVTRKASRLYSSKDSVLLGIISGLAVLTRFEGYILFGSVGLGFLLSTVSFKSILNVINSFIKNLKQIILYVIAFLFVVGPWMLYRNPLVSSYFEEPTGREYDFEMVWIYGVSLIFIFGFTSAFYFIYRNYKNLGVLLFSNIPLLSFIVLELILILLWPAAVPRLFVPIIPFLILFLILSLQNHFNSKEKFKIFSMILCNLFLLGFYVVSQYVLRLQFLIPVKEHFVLLILLQILIVFFLFKNNFKGFIFSLLVSSFMWSLSVIFLHRSNFISIKNAAEYASQNISGIIAYNDVSSVSDWYLNVTPTRNFQVSGYYYNFEKDALLTYESLMDQPLDYLLITNEHNTTMEIDLEKRPYLTLIKEFGYNVSGKFFTSRIVKLNKEYKYD